MSRKLSSGTLPAPKKQKESKRHGRSKPSQETTSPLIIPSQLPFKTQKSTRTERRYKKDKNDSSLERTEIAVMSDEEIDRTEGSTPEFSMRGFKGERQEVIQLAEHFDIFNCTVAPKERNSSDVLGLGGALRLFRTCSCAERDKTEETFPGCCFRKKTELEEWDLNSFSDAFIHVQLIGLALKLRELL